MTAECASTSSGIASQARPDPTRSRRPGLMRRNRLKKNLPEIPELRRADAVDFGEGVEVARLTEEVVRPKSNRAAGRPQRLKSRCLAL